MGPPVNLHDAVKLTYPESYTTESKITTLSCLQPELWQFKRIFNFPQSAIVFLIFLRINQLNIKFKFSHPKRRILG